MNQTKMTIGHHALPSAIGAGLENTVVPHFGGRLVESDSKSLDPHQTTILLDKLQRNKVSAVG